jgi:hypothetical protein
MILGLCNVAFFSLFFQIWVVAHVAKHSSKKNAYVAKIEKCFQKLSATCHLYKNALGPLSKIVTSPIVLAISSGY